MRKGEKEAKIIEDAKNILFIKGSKTSEVISSLIKELYLLKKPYSFLLSQREELHPFDSPVSLELLSKKTDTNFFIFGSHSKKRPNNLVMGRFFDTHVFDMIELGVDNFETMYSFDNEKIGIGQKPCLLFIGEEWQHKEQYKMLSNMLLDLFDGEHHELVNLAGLEHIVIVTAVLDIVTVRVYRILLKKSGSRLPRVELSEMGPRFDLTIRRHQLPTNELNKYAHQIPQQLKERKIKNVKKDLLETRGTLHIPRQDLTQLATRKMKGLPNGRKRKTSDEEVNEDQVEDMLMEDLTDNSKLKQLKSE